jgi:hypothetical protein
MEAIVKTNCSNSDGNTNVITRIYFGYAGMEYERKLTFSTPIGTISYAIHEIKSIERLHTFQELKCGAC